MFLGSKQFPRNMYVMRNVNNTPSMGEFSTHTHWNLQKHIRTQGWYTTSCFGLREIIYKHSTICCKFWPAFGCSALKILIKICWSTRFACVCKILIQKKENEVKMGLIFLIFVVYYFLLQLLFSQSGSDTYFF